MYPVLVSLDSHKTLTPLIATKLRVSRVTALRPGQVQLFVSPSSLPLLASFLPSFLHRARCTLAQGRSPRQSPRHRAGSGVAEEPRTRRSFLFSSGFLSALAGRPDDLVPRQFPRGSFGVLRTLPRRSCSLAPGDRLHFSIAIRVPCPVP